MNAHLSIVDLNYLENSEAVNLLGGYVSTTAYSSVGSGSAIAYGNAAAYGQQTSTNTTAITSVQYYSSSTKSYAKATATASATSHGVSQQSSYRSTSFYYYGR